MKRVIRRKPISMLDDPRVHPEPNSGCWLWGGDQRNGYGKACYEGKYYALHRLSWSLVNGPIPEGLFICHKCNVKTCVNPDHLYAGTQTQNMADRKRTGKPWGPKGENTGKAVLTDRDVIEIRRLKSERSVKDIAALYNMSASTVFKILSRTTWRHI